MITISELANVCDVSVATVSRAFSPNGKINAGTKARIIKKASELGYAPSTIARGLQSKTSNAIGIIVPEISNQFYFNVIQNMEALYRNSGYHFIIGFYEPNVSDEAEIIEHMASCRVDALIFSPRDRASEKEIRKYFPAGNVLQMFTAPYEEYPGVVTDDIGGTRQATEYLIKCGKRRIMYYGDMVRAEGYLDVIRKNGLSTDGLFFANRSDSTEEAAELIKESHPEAIIAVARRSEKIVSALQTLNMRFPDDVSIIVYDDVEWTKMLGITAVTHPFEEISKSSVSLILNGIKSGFKPERITVRPYLKIRNSVK